MQNDWQKLEERLRAQSRRKNFKVSGRSVLKIASIIRSKSSRKSSKRSQHR